MAWRSALICTAVGVLLACSQQPAKPAPESKTRPAATSSVDRNAEGALHTLRAVAIAYLKGDGAALADLLTEDYTLTNATGEITMRQDEIENAKSGAVRYQVFENLEMKARLYGDSAVVLGLTRVKGQAGLDFFDAEFQFTDTLVWQQGRWRLAATHVSRLKSEIKRSPTEKGPQEQR